VAASRFARVRSTAALALSLPWLALARGEAASSSAPARDEVAVFAAVSLADALSEIGAAWQAAAGHRVAFHFGATSDLERQIRRGAAADVFVSADAAHVDRLEREGLVRAQDRHDLLSNTLVVIVPSDSPARVREPRDLAGFATLALADPDAAPAGVYAREWLAGLGLWDGIARRVVPCLDARAALVAVASGNVEAGVVYRTDALQSRRVRIAFEVAPERGPRIRYVVARLAASDQPAAAALVAHLRSPAAREVFVRHGFRVPEPE
jgi:molybdate transport system substrate-binding protein